MDLPLYQIVKRTPRNSLTELIYQYPPPGWEYMFEQCRNDLKHIDEMLSKKGRYFPDQVDVFKVYDLCPPTLIKIVIIGQDPYHTTYNGLPQANGISFSTNKGCPIQPSLLNMYKELKNEYPEFTIPKHGDLTEWVEQGVFLLNSCLTVTPGKPNSHDGLWDGIINRTISYLNHINPQCVWIFLGKNAATFDSKLTTRAIKLYSSHPSPLSATRGFGSNPAFIGSDIFKKANEKLIEHGKEPINWDMTS
jgi:uracil-DNA glycosylase